MTGQLGPSLAIELVTAPGVVTVVIRGELDLVTAPLLSRQLASVLDDRPWRLIFDMAGVDFIDCAALRLIASTSRYLPAGRRPVIRNASAAVRRTLKVTGLAADCEIDPSSEMPEQVDAAGRQGAANEIACVVYGPVSFFPAHFGKLYVTRDGGQHWQLVTPRSGAGQ